jgi:hypothetical protein
MMRWFSDRLWWPSFESLGFRPKVQDQLIGASPFLAPCFGFLSFNLQLSLLGSAYSGT